jgi:formiminoglutamase
MQSILPHDTEWLKHYSPPDKTNWQGRSDDVRYHTAVACHDLRVELADDNKTKIGIIGFACDEGVKRNFGRAGAALGPKSFRQSLGTFPYHLPHDIQIYDFGDIICPHDDLEKAQEYLGMTIALLKKSNYLPVVIGGGHEMAWGNYQGFQDLDDLAIVNIDAHYDLRAVNNNKGNSGTSFTQIAEQRAKNKLPFNYYCLGILPSGNTQILHKKAKDLDVHTVCAEQFYADASSVNQEVQKIIRSHKNIYLTLCLDVFAAPYVPGVSAPQVLGILPWHAIPIINTFAASKKIICFDVAELSPPLDKNFITSKLAASIVDNFLRHVKE